MYKSITLIVILCGFAFCHSGPTVSKLLQVSKAVDGIDDCGSLSDITDIRVTDCTAVPCEAVVGNQYRIEIDFRPRASHSSLHLNIVLIHQGEFHTIVEGEVPDSAVIGGSPYTFGYSYNITGAFMGRGFISFNLLGDASETEQAELCFFVELRVVSP